MTDRLFFALWPGERQRQALASVQGQLPSPGGRRTHPDDFHITLAFLGDLESDGRACAEEAGNRIRSARFALTLDELGCFLRAGILWCGVSAPPEPLLDLVDALNRALADCGFVPERRPYKPHVTLVRKGRQLTPRPLVEPVSWQVDEFVLAISLPNGRPRYRVERRWPLAL